jgi:quercetin dioxygenase-like cupin family protein
VSRGWSHSVRNIGQTAYRAVAIDLLRQQTNARDLCGNQIANMKPACPTTPSVDSTSPRVDTPQFETDQMSVALVSIRPHQQSSFGDAKKDELMVAVDEAMISVMGKKDPDQLLSAGSFLWIARGSAKRLFKNNSDHDLRLVSIDLKP